MFGEVNSQQIRYYEAKLEKDFSSFSFQSYEKKDIDEQLIYDLINLSKVGISERKFKFSINNDYAKCIAQLAKLHGVVNIVLIDGQLCAGAISYWIGADQTTEVIAHDEKFNSYPPGMLCFYLAICESITKGIKKYHMGGGRLPYKVSLSGVHQEMEQVEIYRPYWGKALNYDWILKAKIKVYLNRLRKWLRGHEANVMVQFLLQSRYAIRKMMKLE